MNSHRYLTGPLLALFAAHSYGSDLLPWGPTPSEMLLLPPYCKVRATDNHKTAEWRLWEKRLGKKFIDMHHYCAALNNINRYLYRGNDPNRDYYLSLVVREIDYVARGMPRNFPLAGDIYLNRGIALELQGKKVEAAADFSRAIQHNPRLTRAYVHLADINSQVGDKAKALEIVKAGLDHQPNSKLLQKRYAELGGQAPPAPSKAQR